MPPSQEDATSITDSLFIPGSSDREVDPSCRRPLCCLHQPKKYCIAMGCQVEAHVIRHDADCLNTCLHQAEQEQELQQERHSQHMLQWESFCHSHPNLKYLCVYGIELKQSIQVVELLLTTYHSSLRALNLVPFCTSHLILSKYDFPLLMFLTIERIDSDVLDVLLPKLPQLRGIYASKSNFDKYPDLADGVQFIVETYFNMQSAFFGKDSDAAGSCLQLLSKTEVIVINGGPFPSFSDDDLQQKLKDREEPLISREGIKFYTIQQYVKYGDDMRQDFKNPRDYQHPNYLLEVVDDSTLKYLSGYCDTCTHLRINNADLTRDGLACLAKFAKTQFVHITLYHGQERCQSEDIIPVVRQLFTRKHFQKFELFGRFAMTKRDQEALLSLTQESPVSVYLYTHETCLWWNIDSVNEEDISIDGICVFNKNRAAKLGLHVGTEPIKPGRAPESGPSSGEVKRPGISAEVTIDMDPEALKGEQDSTPSQKGAPLATNQQEAQSWVDLLLQALRMINCFCRVNPRRALDVRH